MVLMIKLMSFDEQQRTADEVSNEDKSYMINLPRPMFAQGSRFVVWVWFWCN